MAPEKPKERSEATSKSSLLHDFHKLTRAERLDLVSRWCGLSEEEKQILGKEGSLPLHDAERMAENVIGTYSIPISVATNFLINNRDCLIPMANEETSVVAAASKFAKMTRQSGGVFSKASPQLTIGQLQITHLESPDEAVANLLEHKNELIDAANQLAREKTPTIIRLGGGVKDIEFRRVDTEKDRTVIVHLIVDTVDAMGANAVNTICEVVAPHVERIAKGKVLLRVLSNLSDRRIVRASVVVDKNEIGGEEVVDKIEEASAFAAADPYRAVTHNKGIMNGIVAVALATGQDTRAVEAAAHAHAARSGAYTSLSRWRKNKDGNLVGILEVPIPVGTVGGAIGSNPAAKIALKMLNVRGSAELAEIMCAVGLVQNGAALLHLATEGIQKGHMKLHARNHAVAAGAEAGEIDDVAEAMIKEGRISLGRAQELIAISRKADGSEECKVNL